MENLQELTQLNNSAMLKYKNTLNNEMKQILTYARANFIPVLLDDTAKLLFNTIYNFKPSSVLEIGTAIGYSGTLILNACNCNLTTIENFESNYNLAKTHFADAGLTSRVNMIFDDALNGILELEKQGKKFDFIFLDGPKGQYIKYLPILKNLLSDGGILFADNVHFKGMVFWEGTIPHRKRTIVVNLRKFLAEIKADADFSEYSELKLGDGVMIAKLK